jgi:hypothetical protein
LFLVILYITVAPDTVPHRSVARVMDGRRGSLPAGIELARKPACPPLREAFHLVLASHPVTASHEPYPPT